MIKIKAACNTVFVCVMLCLGNIVIAQSFLNLDFEYSVTRAQPRKWAIEGEGESFSAQVDSKAAKSGQSSLYVTQKKSELYIFLRIPGRDIAGKRIKVEGYIKFARSDSLEARLLFAQPGHRPVSSNPVDANIKDWQPISNEIDFPANFSSDRLLVALSTSGTGEFWFDHVKITIDGKPYGIGKPDFGEPRRKEIETLNQMAVPIKYPDFNLEDKELGRFKNIIDKASIVSLGENSHGSSSIYKCKLGLVKYLIKELGFTVFALEAPVVEADIINQYVLYGKGTKEAVIRNLAYKSWQTQDMLSIIEWMKSYNQKTNNKVEFLGFDMQNGTLALQAVEDFAKAHDENLARQLLALKKINQQDTNGRQNWEATYKKADLIFKYLNSKNDLVYLGIESNSLSRIKHYMHVYLQSLSLHYKTDSTRSRDEYMAENIDWIIKKSGNGRKIILSADNTHVSKESSKMGSYLKSIYGEKYLAFGFTFNTGMYSAYGEKKYYEVYPSYAGTYEYLFSKCWYKDFLLDIRKITNISLLDRPTGFRSIGSKPQETTQFTDIVLKTHFDVIVFLENSIHTIYLTE